MFLDIFNKEAYFPANWLHIKLSLTYRGSTQPLLVISQFSQFCVITAYISAEGHLSKNSYENFYSPWPSLTFKTIIIFHVKPFFTSAQGPTVNNVPSIWISWVDFQICKKITRYISKRMDLRLGIKIDRDKVRAGEIQEIPIISKKTTFPTETYFLIFISNRNYLQGFKKRFKWISYRFDFLFEAHQTFTHLVSEYHKIL